MYNTDLPLRAELPTAAQLARSSIIASVSALVILVLVVLPSEYSLDFTGVGRLLGLTQMGEIKTQLAAEAAADAAATDSAAQKALQKMETDSYNAILQRLARIETMLGGQRQESASQEQIVYQTEQMPAEQMEETVAGQEVAKTNVPQAEPQFEEPSAEQSEYVVAPDDPAETASTTETAAGRTDEVSFTLAPGQGAEVKLVMREGAVANFAWSSQGGNVNFDTHGDAPGKSVSYGKGRGAPSAEGSLVAAFDGNHGWFWRNRGASEVTVILRTNGDYAEIKRVL